MKIPWRDLYNAIVMKNKLLRECLGINYTTKDVFNELDIDIENNFY